MDVFAADWKSAHEVMGRGQRSEVRATSVMEEECYLSMGGGRKQCLFLSFGPWVRFALSRAMKVDDTDRFEWEEVHLCVYVFWVLGSGS